MLSLCKSVCVLCVCVSVCLVLVLLLLVPPVFFGSCRCSNWTDDVGVKFVSWCTIYTYMHTFVRIACVYKYTNKYIYTYAAVCSHRFIHIRICIHTYMGRFVRVSNVLYMYIHMHIHHTYIFNIQYTWTLGVWGCVCDFGFASMSVIFTHSWHQTPARLKAEHYKPMDLFLFKYTSTTTIVTTPTTVKEEEEEENMCTIHICMIFDTNTNNAIQYTSV